MAIVVSEPAKELVGGGQNAKYIKECTELFLGGKGIEKIRGFELFVNLESLWLNGNKLKKLNNLDAQTRLKALYVHDNQICTLKGSLQIFKFLETLDLSNNQLRDLDKQIRVLERFKFLKELNLKGNPLCEEPDYRLIVVHRMPGLKVLDQHVVTPLERRKAQGLIGGDVASLTVAFGKRVPPYDPAWDEKVPERSVLEQDMTKEAATIRDNLRHEAYMRERGTYLHDPHPEPPRGTSLPPNAGTVKAMQTWKQLQEQQQQQGAQQGGPQQQGGPGAGPGPGSYGGDGSTAAAGAGGAGVPSISGRVSGTALATGRGGSSGRGQPAAISGGSGSGVGRADGRSPSRGGSAGANDAAGDYAARDRLVLYSLRAGQDPLGAGAAGGIPGGSPGAATTAGGAGAGTSGLGATAMASSVQLSKGSLRFEAEEYTAFLKQKAAGAPGWQMSKTVVQL